MKIVKVVLFLFFTSNLLFAQNSNSSFSNKPINKKYLEHLIKIKIDSVRAIYNCNSLVNDSILHLASSHHSDYMIDHRRLSHYEDDVLTKTPQLRANYFGAKHYSVGENVLRTKYNSVIKTKKNKKINTSTYNGLADAIIAGWVNSPGHFKNIVTPKYQITGVAVAIDESKNNLYACQKFARVQYTFRFKENKTLFPYSEYTPAPIVNSFEGINQELTSHNHQWNLKHNDLKKCSRCDKLIDKKPPISLRYENKNFILRIENAEYVKQLIQDKHDGFAIEIVELNDYICGNPTYYTKPSRRNKQCRINGKILKPLFRKELFKGYKKRKPKKDFSFLKYIFGADSIKFFDRFARYKIEKYDSKYFEIKLGRLPKDIDGHWNHNLIYIQDNQVCHVDYFTNYCGDIFDSYQVPEFIFENKKSNYLFDLEKKHITLKVPFKKNIYKLEQEDISAFYQTIADIDYTIDSISIQAFSSVEGDSVLNTKLQINRAQSLINLLKQNQKESVQTNVTVQTDWAHFYAKIQEDKKWKFLTQLSKEELQQQVNQYADQLEPILQEERKAIVKIFGTLDLSDKNLKHYILKEQKQLFISINQKAKKRKPRIDTLLTKYQNLYAFIHHKIVNEKIDTSILLELKMPKYFHQNLKLTERYLLNHYQFPEYFKPTDKWLTYEENLVKKLFKDSINNLSTEFIYNYSKIFTEKILDKKGIKQENSESVLNYIKQLEPSIELSKNLKLNIDKLTHNLYVQLLNHVFITDRKKYAEEAKIVILHLNKFYNTHQKHPKLVDVQLAKTAVYFSHIGLALELLKPNLEDEATLAYAMQLYYQHNAFNTDNIFYQKVIELSKTMNETLWCNMFLKNCKIPFQAFDHEALRDIFCEKCLDKNEFMMGILEAR